MSELPDLPEDDPVKDFERYQKLGREHKWPPWAPTFLTAFSRIPSITQAAEDSHISQSTVHRLMRRNEAFNDAVDEVRNVSLDRLETNIFIRATIGVAVTKTITKRRELPDGGVDVTTIETTDRHISDVLAMFYLKRWRPEYREAYRVEQSGIDGGAIEVSVEEKADEVVQRFNAEVIRLAEHRGTNGASPNGSQ